MRSGQFLILVLLLLALLLGRAAARLTVGAVYLAQATLQNGVDALAAGGQARATGTPRHRPTRHALSRPTIQQRRAQWGQPNPKPAGSSLFAALSRYKSFMVTTMTATGSGLRLRRQGQRGPPPGCSSKQGPCRPPLSRRFQAPAWGARAAPSLRCHLGAHGQNYLRGSCDVIQGSAVSRWTHRPGGSDSVTWNQKIVDSVAGEKVLAPTPKNFSHRLASVMVRSHSPDTLAWVCTLGAH